MVVIVVLLLATAVVFGVAHQALRSPAVKARVRRRRTRVVVAHDTDASLLPGIEDGTGEHFAPLLHALEDRLPFIVVRYPDAPLEYVEYEQHRARCAARRTALRAARANRFPDR